MLMWCSQAMPRLAEGERQSMPYKILHPILRPPSANGGVTQTTDDQSKPVTAGLEHSVPATVSKVTINTTPTQFTCFMIL